MRFSIRNLLEMTVLAAILLTVGFHTFLSWPGVVFVVHFGAIALPILIGFWGLLFWKQRGTSLDYQTTGVPGVLFRFAGYCLILAAAFWICAILSMSYSLFKAIIR